MNPKELISRQFIDLEGDFMSWLKTLGYTQATIATRKRNIREFLLYLERCDIITMDQAASEKIRLFVRYLKRLGEQALRKWVNECQYKCRYKLGKQIF